MKYTAKIQKAIEYAIKVHEVDEKQKRKGKDIPYITHPLTVGLILANAGAAEDLVVAGLLHDVIEDGEQVTKEMITEEFGQNVSDLVLSVTEQNKDLSWEERKAEALNHIETFSNDSLLLKSADIISNTSEIVSDYDKNGEEIFNRFGAPKEKVIENYTKAITAIMKKWPDSPLVEDLSSVVEKLNNINQSHSNNDLLYFKDKESHDKNAQDFVDALNKGVMEGDEKDQ